MADFTMPALGADMATGKVVEWHVKPGDRVRSGDVVAVIETHKGAIDVECFLDGTIDDLAPLDQELPVGAVLARVHGAGQAAHAEPEPVAATAPVAAAATASALATAAADTAAAPTSAPAPKKVEAAAVAPSVAAPPDHAAAAPRQSPVAAPPVDAPARRRARASPAARRRAAELDIDVDALRGTGPGGVVTLADVELAGALPRRKPATAASRPARGGFDPTQMRQAIGAAMARSKREIPHYYLQASIDFAAAQAWLDAYNDARDPAERMLAAALLLKASALALAQVPALNGLWQQDHFVAGSGIHVGWAIAMRGGGLVAPAIHDADRRTPAQLMTALRELVARARAGGLRSSEITDPTVTVTSLGDRGAEAVLGVIYPPQVAIVGFGRIVQRAWVVDGCVEPRPVIGVSLAADHRASDGQIGGRLLASIDRALQSPQDL